MAFGTVQATTLPFPGTLAGVSVSINGVNAPLYYVSSGLVICVVPYELTGSTAMIVLTNNNTQSNSVTVGALPFSPGVLSANEFGCGDAIVTHVNGALVNSANPAAANETVEMCVLGLGALTTPVGNGAGATGVDNAAVQPVLV